MALAMVPFDSPHTISYYCSIATMSLFCTVFEILLLISQDLKKSGDSKHTPFGSNTSCIHSYSSVSVKQCTKFELEVPNFTNYEHMINSKFKKTGRVILTTPLLGVVCHCMLNI